MTNAFRSRIHESMADPNLQSALDANAIRRTQAREAALETLANPQAARERARRVRIEVIEHLDSYLEQFIGNAQENGIQVHRAVDAAQAVHQVLEIANLNSVRLIAKSKSMLSEEIGLNHALIEQGLEVVETDLGEYIVQLRGETPSHIITPAVHLRRQDVGKLFEEKLGLPYTEDISTMTQAARRVLRRVFLDADMGISGVNFGVAETGTLCLVTNEGNGRMVTTIPPVHVALMGIERLVPSANDLALMLSLLPRSATGQKLSAYTSLLNSPRHSGDPDGPRERHLILVDNGRSEVRDSGLREILYCIRCGSCLNACPVFREIGGHAYVSLAGKGSPYPGPMGSVVSPALFGHTEYGHLARASSLCGACRDACPVDIDLPKLLLRVRAGVMAEPNQIKSKSNAPPALASGLWIYSQAASSPWLFRLSQKVASLFGSIVKALSRGDGWIRLPKITGWGYSKDFPLPAARPFRSRFRYRAQKENGTIDQVELPGKGNSITYSIKDVFEKQEPAGLARFTHELEALGGKVQSCSITEVPEKILKLLRDRELDQLLVWEAPSIPPEVLEKLSTAGICLSSSTAETLVESSEVRAGLTGATAGIVDTGSLLLLGGQGRPLTSSLLPEIHIALVWEKDIFENLVQVLCRDDVKTASAAVIISGPSRTGDIEMISTIGVHGPGELHVLCITG